MMETASTVNDRPRLRVRRLLLAWGLCSLAALVGVVGPGVRTPAAAWDVNPNVVRTLGGVVKAAPKANLARSAAVCAGSAGTGCIIGGAILLGQVAYSTRDTWMPWVANFFNKDHPEDGGSANYGCGSLTMPSAKLTADRTGITVQGAIANCGSSTSAETTLNARVVGARCVDGAGTVSPPQATSTLALKNDATGLPGVKMLAGGTASGTKVLCAVGSVVREVTLSVYFQTGSVVHETATKTIGGKAPVYGTTTTVRCRDAQGGIHQLTAADPVRGDQGVTVPSCSQEGWLPDSVTVSGPEGTLLDVEFPDPTFDYPACFVGGEMVCVTEVYVDDYACSIVGGDRPSHCTDWWSYKESRPQRVECRFGDYVVAYKYCEPLKRAYPSTKTVSTVPDTAGEWQPDADLDATPDPAPQPQPQPGDGGLPSTGTNPTTPSTTPTPETSPDSQGCFGDAWSWNPVDWVYVPVKCAFLWAFKPSVSLQTRVGTVQAAFADAPPFSMFAGMAALPATVPSGGCPDWRVKVGSLDSNVVCDSSFTAAIRSGRPIFAALMIGAAFAPFMRSLAYSAVPILSPVPH